MIEFASVEEAFQHMDASGWGELVVRIGGRYYLTTRDEAHRPDVAVEAFFYYVQRDDGSKHVTVDLPADCAREAMRRARATGRGQG